MNPAIILVNRHPRLRPAHRQLELLARKVFSGEHHRGIADVILSGSKTIRALNRRFLKHDYATDVLSFPFGAKGRPDASGYWGEIYINLDYVNQDAKNHGVLLKEALAWRLVHGLLHLFGYDHRTKDEVGIMAGREQRYLRYAGFSYLGWKAQTTRRGRRRTRPC